MRPVRILFEPYLIYHFPQFLPLYDLVRRDPAFDVRVSVSGHTHEERSESARLLREQGYPLLEGATDEERYRAIDAFDPDIAIIGWGRRGYLRHVQERKRPVFIMVYHGIGVKASYYTDNDPRINYRAVESPYRAEQLRAHGVAAVPLLTGCVKLDPLYAPPNDADRNVVADLGLPADRPTVLFAPTFYPSSIGILRHTVAEATSGCNLLIKLHNYTCYHPDYQEDHAIMKDVAARYSHVRLVPQQWYNITPLFRAADLLLTDASSVMFEYLVLNRPIVVCRKHKLYLRHRLFPWFYIKNRIDSETLACDDFYDSVKDPKRLRVTLERALAEPKRLAPQRAAARAKMLQFDDGASAKRLLEHIRRIAAERGLL